MKVKTELTFPSNLKDQPILCDLCKKFAISMNILEASFSTETGWAIVILEGANADINRTLDYLKTTGVALENTVNLA
jgi:L-aspartate semialdehyde sulfurtransferase ferredoxin